MIIQKTITFCKNQTSPLISNSYFNSLSDVLDIQINGVFNSGLIKVEARNISNGDWVSLAGINLSDFSIAKNGITKSGLYEFSVVGAREIRINVEEISGEVTVHGQLISTEET